MSSFHMSSITNPVQNMIRLFLIACLLPLSLLPAMAKGDTLYYNIAHAINHSQYIDWAAQEGANAIEADLRFTNDGMVDKFQHGTPCECSFIPLVGGRLFWKETGICGHMIREKPTFVPDRATGASETIRSSKDACMVHETAQGYLNTLASHPSPIALFIVDSKVGSSVAKNDTAKSTAGRNVIAALVTQLFDKNYKGKVIVSVDKTEHKAYIRAAAAAAAGTKYANRIYFSFDDTDRPGPSSSLLWFVKQNPVDATIELLNSYAKGKAVYGNGITANAFVVGGFTDTFKRSVSAERNGDVRLNYIWTLDSRSSMQDYLALGVRGIMTNNPGTMLEALQPYVAPGKGGRLARPEDPL